MVLVSCVLFVSYEVARERATLVRPSQIHKCFRSFGVLTTIGSPFRFTPLIDLDRLAIQTISNYPPL